MPLYKYEGQTYNLEDGLSNEEAIQRIQSHLQTAPAEEEVAQVAQEAVAQETVPDPVADPADEGIAQEFLEGVASGIIGIGQGVGELVGTGIDLVADTDVASYVTDNANDLDVIAINVKKSGQMDAYIVYDEGQQLWMLDHGDGIRSQISSSDDGTKYSSLMNPMTDTNIDFSTWTNTWTTGVGVAQMEYALNIKKRSYLLIRVTKFLKSLSKAWEVFTTTNKAFSAIEMFLNEDEHVKKYEYESLTKSTEGQKGGAGSL